MLFKPIQTKYYNWQTNNWHNIDSFDKYISKKKGDMFNVKLEKVTSKLEFKQYKDITNDIQRMIKENGWSQQPLNKKQKIELIRLAKEKGHFMKRGSVKIVGEYLSLTPPTIYKYMKDT